jgi:hypothetical protein
MDKVQKQTVFARPPWDFAWIDSLSDMERLGVIYAKLESVTGAFSAYGPDGRLHTEGISQVYGYWFILTDICDELADILKLPKWHGEGLGQTG